MEQNASFAYVLSDIMRRRYVAAIDVARAVGVSPELVNGWLRGEALPRFEDVETLSTLLGGPDGAQLQQAFAACSAAAPCEPSSQVGSPLSEQELEMLVGLPAAFREAFTAALERPAEEAS